MSNPRARPSITASWFSSAVPRRSRLSREERAPWPASLAVSLALHLGVLALLIVRFVGLGGAPLNHPPPMAQIELVVQNTPTVGAGARQRGQKPTPPPAPPAALKAPPPNPAPPAPAAEALATPPPAPATPAPRPAPATPAHEEPAVRLGEGGDPGTGLVRGPNVIPAGPDSKVHNKPPVYPEQAARRGEQGRVLLLAHVGADGSTIAVDVVESSGYDLLDRAAHDAVAKWRFRPAMADGQPVDSEMPVEINFDLNGRRAW